MFSAALSVILRCQGIALRPALRSPDFPPLAGRPSSPHARGHCTSRSCGPGGPIESCLELKFQGLAILNSLLTMTVLVDSLTEITDRFEAFVIDQWGVLHNGHEPYQTAQVALSSLQRQAKPVLILSNSGRRSQFNAIRLAKLGFAPSSYSFLLSSGEAVWADLQAGVLPNTRRSGPLRKCLAIARAPAEVEAWFEGLTEVSPEAEAGEADIALLLSLRNGAEPEDYDALIAELNKHRLVLLCANPDLVAPSAKGLLRSPGSVAERYAKIGGEVVYYGKPHAPIFRHSMKLLGQPAAARTLMIGDTCYSR